MIVLRQHWRQNGALLEPVIPLGDIPNKAQVRYVLKTEYQPRCDFSTTRPPVTSKRSLRGMRADAVGREFRTRHTYAIDATRGDTYLRSSVNRARGSSTAPSSMSSSTSGLLRWSVLCLPGGTELGNRKRGHLQLLRRPRADRQLVGHEVMSSLSPAPSLPFTRFWLTEVSSSPQAGALTYLKPKVVAQIAAPYRPDMKGIAEVPCIGSRRTLDTSSSCRARWMHDAPSTSCGSRSQSSAR